MVRGMLPKAAAGCATNADVLNHRPNRSWAAPPSFTLSGPDPAAQFGREPPPKENVWFDALPMPSGKPIWNVLTPLTPQPEISLPGTPPKPFSHFWPPP